MNKYFFVLTALFSLSTSDLLPMDSSEEQKFASELLETSDSPVYLRQKLIQHDEKLADHEKQIASLIMRLHSGSSSFEQKKYNENIIERLSKVEPTVSAQKETKIKSEEIGVSPFLITDKIPLEMAKIALSNCPPKMMRMINKLKKGEKVCGESILIVGETGLGKTTMARAIASVAGDIGCIMTLGSRIGSQFQNEGSVNLERLFADAAAYTKENKKPCVLIIDEVEALVRQFNTKSNSDSNMLRTLFGMIDRYKEDQIIFVATSNGIDKLPPMFEDRFTIEHRVSLLTQEQRMDVIKYHLKKHSQAQKAIELICDDKTAMTIAKKMNNWNVRAVGKMIDDAIDILWEKEKIAEIGNKPYCFNENEYRTILNKILDIVLKGEAEAIGSLVGLRTIVLDEALFCIKNSTDEFKKNIERNKMVELLTEVISKVKDPTRFEYTDKNGVTTTPLLPVKRELLEQASQKVLSEQPKAQISVGLEYIDQAILEKFGPPKSTWQKVKDNAKSIGSFLWPYACAAGKESARIAITAAVHYGLNHIHANRNEKFQREMTDRAEEFQKKVIAHNNEVTLAMAKHPETLKGLKDKLSQIQFDLDHYKNNDNCSCHEYWRERYSRAVMIEHTRLLEAKAKFDLANYENTVVPHFDQKK